MTHTGADWALTIESELKDALIQRAAFSVNAQSFLFLRHGRTNSNVKGIIQGQLDVALDQVGREQATHAGVLLKRSGVTRIVSSDLSRALETAKIAAREIGISAPLVDARLRERSFGALQGKIKTDLAWLSGDRSVETSAVFANRTLDGVEAAVLNSTTLICAHGGNLRVLAAALGLTLGQSLYENATPLLFRLSDGRWSCQRLIDIETIAIPLNA
ncbi:histidine phosphatase family protein (plasmid) [Agrobacterium tumefaciens]|uniref:Histidine phosphatase family protein n=1 Tax=Agrobacterium vitis TaxID=373 RepID=A0AAE2R7C3_AGRVI|nr:MULTISPECIES: histidine phosphatase family protein [Agrobacterium]MBF2712720.1 histidine phosphatase family protein [Agrobacterium vitis]MQB13438.1 histidine phosphatase family protein [Agrobacterium sp. ICMP 6402]NSZ19970.1 histidine phosphatase family protein [Agrobacterium vitis]QZO07031.1 histidine phosphatase family protein [Agrobacterium vitis]UJL91290.1 histidine phosphatase family protein [Agrobacterium vitis]